MGLFVTLEGIDGAGKSTQARMLALQLRKDGHEVIGTREPGGSAGAEQIRRLLVEGEPGRWSPESEILLFTAARRDHVERLIGPALAHGKIVICDRYLDSTRAYQGDGPLRQTVEQLHEMMIGVHPDMTIILDVEPNTSYRRSQWRGIGRITASRPNETRYEKKGLHFQAQLRAAFLAIAESEPDRCHVIDATRPPNSVAADIYSVVRERLGA